MSRTWKEFCCCLDTCFDTTYAQKNHKHRRSIVCCQDTCFDASERAASPTHLEHRLPRDIPKKREDVSATSVAWKHTQEATCTQRVHRGYAS
ncbi:hypothetical protein NDU88_006808 [Pleurodeles waltl]|uniref:Uncharacterized protein n=1 Tax=Pleurodeles waltl TaxID=8319 RepID=A0AAV7RNJ2_PLEWA|nr:hypothetical protein NDU88_006808 [Pleurodeles waltl]